MSDLSINCRQGTDRANAVLAAFVFVASFLVYAMTVQRTFSFWDCGEFIACSYILGIPHPPGTPLFILLGRVISLVPFVEDISYRINYMSVVSSSFTAMFSYLLTVKIVRYFFNGDDMSPLNRVITYAGGITGGFFVAFSATNWGNSVEAEVYGLALALSVGLVWLTVRYFEQRGTSQAAKYMILAMYLGVLGIGIHMTVFLVVPACAIFFILKDGAGRKEFLMICAFAIVELLLVILFCNGRGGMPAFMLVSLLLGAVLLVMLYRKINWGIVVALISIGTVMHEFSLFLKVLPFGGLTLVVLAILSRRYGWKIRWKTAMAILVVGVVGFSVHLYIPVRSSLNPRIDENNPSRDFRTFVNFLDRGQYGQFSMIERMFQRRGTWSHQFGRHPHMGFWSYFEEQYSESSWMFTVLFVVGLIGMAVAIAKRLEIGLPFFTLFLLCSAGLILYMNFADGVKYSFETGDAYLEVRNRDYFFTPAFVFFGIAIGLGISALMQFLKDWLARFGSGFQRAAVCASGVLALLPTMSLAHNYHINDRSKHAIPYSYARNMLDACEPNALLFTSGDNDTFPVWCLQEVYDYRKDVRVICLSLLNTDWYVAQMKNRYDVPISLTDEQILWHPFELENGVMTNRPLKRFHDRPRGRWTHLHPQFSRSRTQDLMMDEIVIENNWRAPIYFSSPPYAESPLNLREHAVHTGLLYKLEREPDQSLTDADTGYDLYMNHYLFLGYDTPEVYRDDNATGIYLGVGMTAQRIFDRLLALGDRERGEALMQRLNEVLPEFAQAYLNLAELYSRDGDTAKMLQILQRADDTLTAFLASNKKNFYYRADLGYFKTLIGRRTNDQSMIEEGIDLIMEAFSNNRNNNYVFRKAVAALTQEGQYLEAQRVATQFVNYKKNLNDPIAQQLLGRRPPGT